MINFSIIFIFLLLSVTIINCQPLIDSPTSNVVWNDFLGVNVQFVWFNSTWITGQINALKELNVQWVRADVHWDQLENDQNVFRWDKYDTAMNLIRDNNLKAIVYLVGTPRWASSYNASETTLPFSDVFPPANNTVFAERLLMLQNRYPFVEFWEVWNEMNLNPAFWSVYNPAQYDALFKECQRVFGLAGFSSKMAVGGLGYYGGTSDNKNMIQDLLPFNTFQNVLASYHPYTDLPEGGQGQLPASQYAHLATSRYLNNILATNGKASKGCIWSTEWGWSASDFTLEVQAEYTIRRLLIDSIANFDKTFLFTTSDLDARASSLRDQGYGLVNLALTKKPIFNQLLTLFKITGTTLSPVSSTVTANYLNVAKLSNDFIGIFYSKASSGTTLLAFWSPSGNSTSFTLNLSSNQPGGLLHNIASNSNSYIDSSNLQITLSPLSSVQIFEWPIEKVDSSSSDSSSSDSSSSDSSSSTLPSPTPSSPTPSSSTTSTLPSPTPSPSSDPNSSIKLISNSLLIVLLIILTLL